MLKIHVANPTIGEFIWEPSADFQAQLLGYPAEALAIAKEELARAVEKHLKIQMMLFYSGGELYFTGANTFDVLLEEFLQGFLVKLRSARDEIRQT